MKKLFIIALSIIIYSSGFCSDKNSVIKISNDIQLINIKENIFISKSYTQMPEWGRIDASGMVIVAKKYIVLINTLWNDGQTAKLCDFLENRFKKKVKHLIVTHSHADCMGGMDEALKRKIKIYTLDKTAEIAKKKGKTGFDITFSDTLELNFDKFELEIYYPGGGHTIDNTVVWLKNQKILYGGCLVKELSSTTLGNIAEADLKAYPITLKNVLQRYPNAKLVIPGHGKYGDLKMVEHTRELTEKYK